MYCLEEQDRGDSVDTKSFDHDLGIDNIKGRRRMRDGGVSDDDINMVQTGSLDVLSCPFCISGGHVLNSNEH